MVVFVTATSILLTVPKCCDHIDSIASESRATLPLAVFSKSSRRGERNLVRLHPLSELHLAKTGHTGDWRSRGQHMNQQMHAVRSQCNQALRLIMAFSFYVHDMENVERRPQWRSWSLRLLLRPPRFCRAISETNSEITESTFEHSGRRAALPLRALVKTSRPLVENLFCPQRSIYDLQPT